jgi:hypothetical protein
MLAIDRLAEIEIRFSSKVANMALLEFDEVTLRIIFYLKDGTNLRIAEQWDERKLRRYSYYWLTSKNELIIGWDNAPHHTHVETFPHHKHDRTQKNIAPSSETCLEDVMEYILNYETQRIDP